MNTLQDRLLDTNLAARILGCAPSALTKFRRQRRGPPYVRVGKLIRYRRIDLVRWLKSQRVSPERRERQRQTAATKTQKHYKGAASKGNNPC